VEPQERAVIGLERGIARGSEPAGDNVADVDVEVLSTPGVTVRARAHSLLVGRIRSGANVTIALDPSRRGPSGLEALVVGADDLRGLPNPTGLAGTPVVVVDIRSAGTAAAAARTAGAIEVEQLTEMPSRIWPRLLAGAADPATEVVVIALEDSGAAATATGNVLEGAGLLGTRPVAALTLVQAGGALHVAPTSLEALRDHCPTGVNVAVPALGEPEAGAVLWNDLRRDRLEERHQLVEVDVSAASVGSPRVVRDPGGSAAGILAGRMAVGARRWRPPS
jgi:hypothetical protein